MRRSGRAHHSPRPLSGAFQALQAELTPASALAAVQGVWSEVVGRAIAAEAAPTDERAGVVTVTCSASVWAQELDLMAPQILERLGGQLPAGVEVNRLRCVVG